MQVRSSPPSIDAAEQHQKPLAHRRSRVPLSCEPCRARKLKCNRELPCQNCAARGEQSACSFRGAKNSSQARRVNGDVNGEAMRNRIDKLESLVKKLISDRQSHNSSSLYGHLPQVFTPESPEPEAEPDAVSSLDQNEIGVGKTIIDGVHSVYLGSDDWYAVLREINELKTSYDQEQDRQTSHDLSSALSHTVDGSSLLFNQAKPIERIEILSSLPPKAEVDALISRFFDRGAFPATCHPVLHEPTFMREYNEHWRNPSRTNFIWLGLLFSMLAITMFTYHQNGGPPEYEGIAESRFQFYRTRTAQCLLNGDIAKCLPYTVEALRFNAAAELNRKDDNRRGLWILTGVVVRTAINMGYHRDPANSPEFSVLQAEYRRRLWLSVVSMDDMASFLGGFPRTTTSTFSDTAEPRNLHDWEIPDDPTCTVLPPSRPLSEPTAVTYIIAKGRLLRALGRISDLNSTPGQASYDTVLEIDRAVVEAYECLPSQLKMDAPSLDESNSAQPTPDFSSLSLLGIYYKGMCMLHRRYLARGRVDSRYKFSRDRCIPAAMAILSYRPSFVFDACQAARVRQILALAAMILCFELELRRKIPDPEADKSLTDESLINALRTFCYRWREAVYSNEEESKLQQVLDNMIFGIKTGEHSEEAIASQIVTADTSSEGLRDLSPFAACTEGLSPVEDAYQMDFDWASWDALIAETGHETDPVY